jgi:DNA transformation protein and related proteins
MPAKPRRPARRSQSRSAGGRLLNLGPTSSQWLASVGIHDRRDLEAVGVINAYNLCKAHGYNASLNLLWALQAALMDIPWTQLPADIKDQLRQRLEQA